MDTLYRCIEKMFSLSPESLKSEAFKRAWFERVAVEYDELLVLYSELESRKILVKKYGWSNFVDENFEFIQDEEQANALKAFDYQETMSTNADEMKEEGNEFYFVPDMTNSETVSSDIL